MLKPALQDKLDALLEQMLHKLWSAGSYADSAAQARKIIEEFESDPDTHQRGEKLVMSGWEAAWKGNKSETVYYSLFGDFDEKKDEESDEEYKKKGELVEALYSVFQELIRFVCNSDIEDQEKNKKELMPAITRYLRRRGHDVADKKQVPKRSWTQLDLDNAIRKYKAKHASTYNDLVEGVKRGKAGAKKAAQKIFGRNVIARELGVKSRTMVSNSLVWQEIAKDLGLRSPSKKSGPASGQRIGIGIAMEERAVASGESVVDQVVNRETIALVDKSLPAAEAEATIEKLQRGEITDDDARELAELSAEQQQDDQTRRIRQGL